MSDLTPMVWLVATQFVLYAAGWGLCSLLLREHRMAVAHWALYLLLTGLGFALVCMRDEPRTWWPYVGANLMFMAGYVNLRRGIELFMGIAPHDREQLLTFGLFTAVLVSAGPQVETGWIRVIAAYAGAAWVLSRMIALSMGPMFAEFGKRVAITIGLPALLLIVLFVLRVLQQSLNLGQAYELQRLDQSNRNLLYGYLIGAAIFNFSFVGLLTKRLVGRLRTQTLRDPLTGLPNRRALESALQRQWERLRRDGQTFAVLALDLDHFKQVNDSHGHDAGDAVLAQTGQRLRVSVRSTDTVARTGGEEFIVLVPAGTETLALAMAERLRASICERPFDIPGGRLSMTVSIGMAIPTAADQALGAVLKRADQGLDRALVRGRNRVCVV